MPRNPVLDWPPEAHAPMWAARRRARYGARLALHSVLVCAAARRPTELAARLVCARSRVYRTVRAYRQGILGLEHDDQGRLVPPVRTTVRLPTRRRSLVARLGMEAGHAGGQRRRSAAGPPPGAHPLGVRAAQGVRGPGLCGRTGDPAVAHSRLGLDAPRDPVGRHDPGHA